MSGLSHLHFLILSAFSGSFILHSYSRSLWICALLRCCYLCETTDVSACNNKSIHNLFTASIVCVYARIPAVPLSKHRLNCLLRIICRLLESHDRLQFCPSVDTALLLSHVLCLKQALQLNSRTWTQVLPLNCENTHEILFLNDSRQRQIRAGQENTLTQVPNKGTRW